MKKWMILTLAVTFVALLAACGGAVTEPATSTPPAVQPTQAVIQPPAPDPTAAPGGYPGPQPTAALPAESAYPADQQFWVVRPAGRQCEPPEYADLDSAVAALENAGVTVLDEEEVAVNVCAACGCPTSEQYRILVNGDDVGKAMNLGFVIEQ